MHYSPGATLYTLLSLLQQISISNLKVRFVVNLRWREKIGYSQKTFGELHLS